MWVTAYITGLNPTASSNSMTQKLKTSGSPCPWGFGGGGGGRCEAFLDRPCDSALSPLSDCIDWLSSWGYGGVSSTVSNPCPISTAFQPITEPILHFPSLRLGSELKEGAQALRSSWPGREKEGQGHCSAHGILELSSSGGQ